MIPVAIKRVLPTKVKHPLLAYTRWYWELRGRPAQSSQDISIFKAVLCSAAASGNKIRVFEWGSGLSTIYYSQFLRARGIDFAWYAMENSRLWHDRVQAKIAQANLEDRVQISCADFPGFWQLPGFSANNLVPPKSYTDGPGPREYIDKPKRIGIQFDVILIDGRFRRRCLLVSKEVLASKGTVVLHDAHKSHYLSSLAVYPQVEFLETGVLPGFRTKSTIALCSLDEPSLIDEIVGQYRAVLRSDA